MLSLSNVSVEMGSFYFEKDDYYSRENSPLSSEWIGKGATILGLTNFDSAEYQNLLKGLSPDGKQQIAYIKATSIPLEKFELQLDKMAKTLDEVGLEQGILDEITNAFRESYKGKKTSPLEVGKLRSEQRIALRESALTGQPRRRAARAIDRVFSLLSHSNRRAAYDLTFNAPKSVSLQALINDDQKLLDAHDEAVKFAMSVTESRCIYYKTGASNNRNYAKSDNLVAATFPHGTSREGDPHLHTHVVTFNLTQRSDGKWRAIHNDELYRQSKLLGLAYQTKLAERCQQLGYSIELNDNGTFELLGFQKKHLETFSQRRMQVQEASARLLYAEQLSSELESKDIRFSTYEKFGRIYFALDISEQEAKEHGLNVIAARDGTTTVDGYAGDRSFDSRKEEFESMVTRKHNRVGVLKNRAVKDKINYQEIKRTWIDRAKHLQLPNLSKSKRDLLLGKDIDLQFHESHLGERDSTWTKLQAEVQGLQQNLGRASFEKIVRKLENSTFSIVTDKQIPGELESQTIKTNLRQLSDEELIIDLARKGKDSKESIVSHGETEGIEMSDGLTKGQAEMIKGVLTSTDSIVACLGVAGSGKSTAAATIKRYVEKSGLAIHGLAPDATSARALEMKSEIKSETIHKYLRRGRRRISRRIYDRHRTLMSEKLAASGVGRKDLRKITRLSHSAFTGYRLTPKEMSELAQSCNFHLSKFRTPKKMQNAQAIFQQFLRAVSTPETVLMVDEASKLSTRLMKDLAKRAQNDGDRLVLMGDLRQIGAVEAGNPTRILTNGKHIITFELPETVRQKEDSLMHKIVMEASKSNREGVSKSIEHLDKNVVERKRKSSRIAFAVKEYLNLRERGVSEPMFLADLNADRLAITEMLRNRLRDIGVIGQKEVFVEVLKDIELTTPQKAETRYLKEGWRVEFHKPTFGLEPGVKYEITAVDKRRNMIDLTAADKKTSVKSAELAHAQIFERDEIPVSVGDRLRWTKNHDNRINKHLVDVVEVADDTIVVLDRTTNSKIALSTKTSQFLDFGHVMTVYSSQGHDCNHGIFLAESNVSMNSWYTALSRIKESVKVITDDKRKLLDRVSISSSKTNALDFMEQQSGWTERHKDFIERDAQHKVERDEPGLER